MRLIACTFSAVLLSGCSWMGIGGGSKGGDSTYSAYSGPNNYDAQRGQNYGAQSGQYGRAAAPQLRGGTYGGMSGGMGPCQITAATQAIPRGCNPEQVTLAFGNGSQDYGMQQGGMQQGQYTNAGYGSHAGDAYNQAQKAAPKQRLKKPKLRGQLGLEIDHSVGGDLYAPGTSAAVAGYNRATFREASTIGSIASGQTTTTTYTSSNARLGRILSPNISFDDVYTAPLRVGGGLEYILGGKTTAFANAGYTRAEGKKGGGVSIDEEITKTDVITDYDAMGAVTGTITNTAFIPNESVARFNYDFNELKKYDFEVGARHYFNPIMQGTLQRSLSPFVSVSGGAAHYGKTTVTESQEQRRLAQAFTTGSNDMYLVSFGTPKTIYDAQWVGYGALKGGVEWQMSPKTALAFETGLKYEMARDFSNGTKGDNIISVPVAIRGSYNF